MSQAASRWCGTAIRMHEIRVLPAGEKCLLFIQHFSFSPLPFLVWHLSRSPAAYFLLLDDSSILYVPSEISQSQQTQDLSWARWAWSTGIMEDGFYALFLPWFPNLQFSYWCDWIIHRILGLVFFLVYLFFSSFVSDQSIAQKFNSLKMIQNCFESTGWDKECGPNTSS